MSDQVFIDLHKIEIRDRIEQTAQADLKKKYASFPSDDGEVPEPKRNKKQKSYNKGDRKLTWQGQAIGCELCKAAGMPERNYKSNTADQCNQKERWKKKLSGNTADKQEAITQHKKAWKDFAKSETRRAEKASKELKELRNLIKGKKSSREKEYRAQEKGKKHKRYTRGKEKPEYSSDSESDESSSSDQDDLWLETSNHEGGQRPYITLIV